MNNFDKDVLDFTLESFISYYELDKLKIDEKYFYDHIKQICKSFNVDMELIKSQVNSDYDRNSNNYYIPFELAPILHLMIILFRIKGKSNSKELASNVASYMQKFLDVIIDIEPAYSIKILDSIDLDACCALAYELPRLIDTLALFFKANLNIADSLVSEQISDITNYFDKLTNNYLNKKNCDDFLKILKESDYNIYNLNKQKTVNFDCVYDFSSYIHIVINFATDCFTKYINNEWTGISITSDNLNEKDLNDLRNDLYEEFYYIDSIGNSESFFEKVRIIKEYKRGNEKIMTLKGLKHYCSIDYELYHSDVVNDLANKLKLLKHGKKEVFSSDDLKKYGTHIIEEITEMTTKGWNAYEETLYLKTIAEKVLAIYFEEEIYTYNSIYLANKFIQLSTEGIQVKVDFINRYFNDEQIDIGNEELVSKYKSKSDNLIEISKSITYSKPIKKYIDLMEEKEKIKNSINSNFDILTKSADIMAGQIIAPYISNVINKVK